jgi:methionyl aminopeptidase
LITAEAFGSVTVTFTTPEELDVGAIQVMKLPEITVGDPQVKVPSLTVEPATNPVPDRLRSGVESRPLEEGDIVNLDISVFYKGMHSDLNETFIVGKCDRDSQKLVEGAYSCLMEAIKACKPGFLYRDLGNIIQRVAGVNGLSVVRTYCGHGVGQFFHCAPSIPHYADNKAVGVMAEGHVFTIEPMINQGSYRDRIWPDNWTAVTVDGKRSAQFEHTLLITKTGVEILTARLPTSPSMGFDPENLTTLKK